MANIGYVYYTKNTLNGRMYIGSHISPIFDTKYYGSGKLILRALKLHGKSVFRRKIIYWASSIEELYKVESHFLKKLKLKHGSKAYNLSIDAQNPCARLFGKDNPHYGLKRSEETKRKIGEKLSRYSGKSHWNYGIKRPESMRKKVSESKTFANTSKSKNDVITEILKSANYPFSKLPSWANNITVNFRAGIWQKQKTIDSNLKRFCEFLGAQKYLEELTNSYSPNRLYYKER